MANRSRKTRRSGGKGKASGWVFAVILLAGIVSFYQIPTNPSVSGLWGTLEAKSASVDNWVQNLVGNIKSGNLTLPEFVPVDPGEGGTTGTNNPVGEVLPKKELLADIADIKVGPAQEVDYDRDEWNHWIAQGQSCWSTRDQVLLDEVDSDNIVLLDKNKKETTDKAEACSVKSGEWVDLYTGKTFTNPSNMDIDHMIPLGYAASHGGQSWDAKKKEKYANDLSYADHLVAVDASANRSKSDKGPSEWKPDNKAGWCSYSTAWTTISLKWGLVLPAADVDALTEMAKTCKK